MSRIFTLPSNGADFDTGPAKAGGARYAQGPRPSTKVRLRNRRTGEVGEFYVVDSRESLAMPNTLYERVEPDNVDVAPFSPEAA